MSVYKRKGQETYSFDFTINGVRFTGNTEATRRQEAEKIEASRRKNAEQEVSSNAALRDGPLVIETAIARYWHEVGQHNAAPLTVATNLDRLKKFFGGGKRLEEIKDNDVARLISWRRAQTVKGRKTVRDPNNPKKRLPAKPISPATVNRSTIEPLQKLFNRAKSKWNATFQDEPDWKAHLLKEDQERVREVRPMEEGQVEDAIRADYFPLIEFARCSGLRQAECLLRKDQVDLLSGRITTIGKGRKTISQPITPEMRAILMAEMANPTEYVFTYRAARAKKGKNGYPKGSQQPITSSGLKTLWRRARYSRSGSRLPKDLKFHDLRHDFATKLLRETGNIKLVSRALHHSKIETTTRYAHVLDDEVAAGMAAASRQRAKARKSRKKATGTE